MKKNKIISQKLNKQGTLEIDKKVEKALGISKKDVKDNIDKYVDNKSPEELIEICKKYGIKEED